MKAFLAVSLASAAPADRLRQPTPGAIAKLLGAAGATAHVAADGWVAFAAPDVDDRVEEAPSRFTVRLGRAARTRAGDLDAPALATMLGDGSGVDAHGLTALLPPFAAAHRASPGAPIVVAGDWLGFRQLFWWQGAGAAAVSTSALALAALACTGLDTTALGLQSLVGWQMGTATLFRDVTKLAPGCVAVLHEGRVTIRRYADERLPIDEPPPLSDVVEEMATILREWETTYLNDHPKTVLQLTGGHDSRILLGAVPPQMRTGLRALTLDTHGGPDATIAGRLSAAWGLEHQVHWLDEQPAVAPATAHQLAVDAATALDCMASPLALAPLALAERSLEQGHRLSGLGGEVARGFYYGGQPRRADTNRRLVERLAQWRLFSNEAVEREALDQDFVARARTDSLSLVEEVFAGYDRRWLRAVDEFYLYQRMHRWAGAHSSVAAAERVFVNPMLDRRFLTLALATHPVDKRDSRLLGQLMCHLDPALGRLPLDSGLAPARLASRGPMTTVAVARLTARKAVRKARQRLAGGRRPQLGATEMAALVVAHWRSQPETVEPLRSGGLVNAAWLDELIDARREAQPTTIAFLVNLMVAAQAAEGT